MPNANPTRRSFMKLIAAAPLLTQIAARDLYAQAATAVGKTPGNVYTRLGVKTIINCRGVRAGSTTQNIFMILKLVAIAALVVFGLTVSGAPSGKSTLLRWNSPKCARRKSKLPSIS